MNKRPPKTRQVFLECEHSLWMKHPWPRAGELLWCVRCDSYRVVGAPQGSSGPVLEADYQWSHRRTARGYVAECTVEDCSRTASYFTNWSKMVQAMEGHHMREHQLGTLLSRERMTVVARPGRNAEPPF